MAVSERSAAPRSGAVLLADGEVQQHRSAAEAPEKRAEVSLPDERVSERQVDSSLGAMVVAEGGGSPHTTLDLSLMENVLIYVRHTQAIVAVDRRRTDEMKASRFRTVRSGDSG